MCVSCFTLLTKMQRRDTSACACSHTTDDMRPVRRLKRPHRSWPKGHEWFRPWPGPGQGCYQPQPGGETGPLAGFTHERGVVAKRARLVVMSSTRHITNI